MLQMEFSHDKANEVIKDFDTLFTKLLEDLIKEINNINSGFLKKH